MFTFITAHIQGGDMYIPINEYDKDLEVFHAWAFQNGYGRLDKRKASKKLAAILFMYMVRSLHNGGCLPDSDEKSV